MGMENYVKARMFSTINWIRNTFNRKAHVQNDLQYFTQSPALPPPTAEKRLIEYGFNFQERQKIYSLPFRVTNEVKLSVFQYKIVHNILYTNKILHKMKKKKATRLSLLP